MTSPSLVVSIHDVSPFTRAETAHALEDLREDGVSRCSLLVIPDHHGRGHIADAPGFGEWLRELEMAGHEIVLHGYFHRRTKRSGERAVDRVVTRLYTAGEGEFFDLEKEAAAELLRRGIESLRRLGVTPAGFVAPAWLLGGPAEEAVREAGFLYTTRLTEVLALRDGRRWRSQSLCWSVRSGWRRAMSRCWNRVLARLLRDAPLMRIGVHPPDLAHPPVWRQIRSIVREAAAERRPVTYREWVETA